MKRIGLFLIVTVFFLSAWASAQEKIAIAGISFNGYASPNVQGFGAVGIPISANVISYTGYDVAVIPGQDWRNFQAYKLQYSMKTGLAIRVKDLSPKVSLWGLGAGGLATDGSNHSSSFAAGGFLDVAFSKGWGALLILQVDRNAATGAQFTPRIGIRRKL
jgi:hypothetical protein